MSSHGHSALYNRKPHHDHRHPAPAHNRPTWKAHETHLRDFKNVHLRQLFAEDPRRGERLNAEAAGLFLDYSKNRVTDETLRLLLQLAEECGLRSRIDAMFRGEKINVTEQRAVLHVAPRAARPVDRRGWHRRRAPGPLRRSARHVGRWPAFQNVSAARQVAGPYGQADSQGGQHRHRRLGLRAGDGLRGLAGTIRCGT